MARVTALQAVELKIVKAQEQVSKTKKAYDTAIANLSNLLDERDAIRRDELVKAIMKSNKTYEEVMAFLNTGKGRKR
jgi:hypothetical protein